MLRATPTAAVLRWTLLALAGFVLAGCAVAPKPGPVTFREIQREDDVYRVIAKWQGVPPGDIEERLLVRCAELARQDGGTTFLVVNADFDVTNTAFLKDGSAITPVFKVPVAEPEEGAKGQAGPPASVMVTIKWFRPGKAPVGYRIYDVEKILRLRKAVSVRVEGSTGAGAATVRAIASI